MEGECGIGVITIWEYPVWDRTIVVVWITVETEEVRSVFRVVAVSESVVLIVSGTFSVAIACITDLTKATVVGAWAVVAECCQRLWFLLWEKLGQA